MDVSPALGLPSCGGGGQAVGGQDEQKFITHLYGTQMAQLLEQSLAPVVCVERARKDAN